MSSTLVYIRDKCVLFKDYTFLALLYLVPFICYILLLLLFILSICSVFFIPYVIYENALSSRSKGPIIVFLIMNVIAQYRFIRVYRKFISNSEKKEIFPENKIPAIFNNLFIELKDKYSITKKISISIDNDEFFVFKKKNNLVINIPLISLQLLEPKHLKIILEHEILHYLHWDTSFNSYLEKSAVLLEKVKSHLELKSVSLLNPIYWILNLLLLFQKKVFLVRRNISEKIIYKKLESDSYHFAISRVYIADFVSSFLILEETVSERDTLIELFKEAYNNVFSKSDSETLEASETQSSNFKIEWDTLCYNDFEVQALYQALEINFLTLLFFTDEPEEIVEKEIVHNEEIQELLSQSIIKRVHQFFIKLEFSIPEFEMVSLDRSIIFKSDIIEGEKNERFIVSKISTEVANNTNLKQELKEYGKDSKERYPYQLNSYYLIILDNFDEIDIEYITKASYRYLPSSFQYILSVILSHLPIPIHIKCGGIIPVFISIETGKLHYKIPFWAFYRRFLLFGFKSIWKTTNSQEEKSVILEENELNTSDLAPNYTFIKWGMFFLFIAILIVNLLILYDEGNLNFSNVVLIVGIVFFISGSSLLLFHFPILLNNIFYLYTFGKYSVTFDSQEEKELFILFEKEKAIIKKRFCFVLMSIGVAFVMYYFLLEP